MNILIAPDKFKGTLSAQEVCEAIGAGLKSETTYLKIVHHPMADGGDGSLEVLAQHLPLKQHFMDTVGPLGRPIRTHYFSYRDSAFIEVASASGLILLAEKERNPMQTSSLGTGKMLVDALRQGFQKIYLFLGGSATNDAGIGIASALGFYFLDKNNQPVLPIGGNLNYIQDIDYQSFIDFKKTNIILLCDVNNPFCGVNGAAQIFASQKGGTPEQVKSLDKGLHHFSQLLKEKMGKDVRQISGSGAAGGIGGGLVALLNATIESGFDTLAKITHLEEKIKSADWVISGEGKLDQSSLHGKVVSGIAKFCKKHNTPFAIFVGENDLQQHRTTLPSTPIFSIFEKTKNRKDAMTNGKFYLQQLAHQFKKSHLKI